jgi:predicted ATP-binding protein involved in virulence
VVASAVGGTQPNPTNNSIQYVLFNIFRKIMRVRRLKMQSFRGIDDLTLEFSNTSPTVIIGINGVGKTSILECLAILLSQLIGRIKQRQEVPLKNQNTGINVQGQKIHIAGNIFGNLNLYTGESNSLNLLQENLGQIRDLSDQDVTVGHDETNNEIEVVINSLLSNWSISKTCGINNSNNSTSQQLAAIVEHVNSRWQTEPSTAFPLAVYYRVNRAVTDILLDTATDESTKQIDAYEQALNGIQINFNTFFQWFKKLEDLENEIRQDEPLYRNRQLQAVRAAVNSLIPDFSNLRVRRVPLRMTVTKEGKEFTINQLSDGEKCLLALVGDLARRLAIANPSLENPLEGEGVVLIDEIELHLHPKWQREIIPSLIRTFPKCQFIVTTHSPQVISHVESENIFILEKTENRVIIKHPDSSFGRDSNRILEDLMGVPARPQAIKNDLHELFQLIEEGNLEAAKQLRRQIADKIGDDEPELAKASTSIRRKEILKR